MQALKRFRMPIGALAGAAILTILGSGTAFADIPFGQPINGKATWYNDAGYGACGTLIDASSQMLAAVSYAYWTTANPNNDPLCSGVSVKVTYNGTTITVPVKDKCPSCDSTHVDLSAPAFQRLAGLDVGVINLTWQFVRSGAPERAAAVHRAVVHAAPGRTR
ncbi:RlpA-like double-psi beta-barrel domain-containing protein [Actinoallomurus purpureus]|uniref:cysteine/serine endopeptidase inhibitor n=1 Tax=Actinoallomurus purpureus TaxID=478114 RepID=UPI002092732E|nr:cysteine/serine endopeptidase inhibitor [Actinoallomurus purpureus]MCO6006855.1 RlpA-like double-psi beta-barrel domain-containing protein [Actinoallomurus purpureus]